ncbi:hypothetical protein ACFW9O_17830 [Streptomyces sp. NPDC059499]|uniref:phage tail protein n=1 Tax=Streptomyces sp. NPDC059499 TaxID=3346852 RepID=UPI00369BE5A8
MALVIGDLVGMIRADDSGMRRGLANAQLRMRGFRRDVESNLRELHHRFNEAMQRMGENLGDSDREGNRFAGTLGRLGGMASSLGGVAASIGKMGAMLGAAAPLAAGLVATLANIAPAAALGVSAMLALKLATATVKLGMTGVDDAMKAALDPEKAAEFEKALAKLSPSARAFALEVKKLAPEFKKLQQDVQERMFKGFDKVLKGMSTSTLPVLRKALLSSADALNKMGKGVGQAAISLSKDGTLGTALKGATNGLHNLSRIPGQLVTGLTQVAAAAAPAFSRLTKAAGKAFDRFSEQFTAAFKSGRIEAAIEQAIDLIGQLGKVAGNVFKILGSVFKAAQTSGGGFIGVLQDITGSLAKAFASPEVQAGLKGLFQTMSTLGKVAAPLLSKAVVIIAQVFAKLAGPAQQLIRVLGDGLSRILTALGPVLVSLAGAAGSLVVAFLPIVDLAADLIVAILPALVPLFDALSAVFVALAPVIEQIAANLSTQLVPLFEALVPILTDLLPPFVQLVEELGPQLTQILAEMAPYLADAAIKIAEMAIAMAPLTAQVLSLAATILGQLLPVIGPILVGLIIIVSSALTALSDLVTHYVIPAIKGIAALLQGDFSGAMEHAKTIVNNFKEDALRVLSNLLPRAGAYLREFAGIVGQHAKDAGGRLVRAVAKGVADAIAYVRALPGRIKSAIPSPGQILNGIGRAIVQGLISGIKSMIPSVQSTLSNLTSMIPDWKGPEEVDKKLLIPAGQSLMGGLMGGIASQIPALRSQLGGITGGLPGMAMAGGGGSTAGGGRVVLELRSDGSRYSDFLVGEIRKAVDVKGGGDVQTAFGKRR